MRLHTKRIVPCNFIILNNDFPRVREREGKRGTCKPTYQFVQTYQRPLIFAYDSKRAITA